MVTDPYGRAVVCYTAVFRGGALRDDSKNGCVAHKESGRSVPYPEELKASAAHIYPNQGG